MRNHDRRSCAPPSAPLPQDEDTGRKPRRRWTRPDVRRPGESAFATRRAVFGPHELREDRITAESYLADDLSPAARRALREGADA